MTTTSDMDGIYEAWADEFGSRPLTTKTIYEMAKTDDLLPPDLAQMSEHAAKSKLGERLAQPTAGTDKYRVEQGPPDRHRKVNRYRLTTRSTANQLLRRLRGAWAYLRGQRMPT